MHFLRLHSMAIFLMCAVLPSVKSTSNASESSAIALIRNNINLYSLLIDTKNYQALDQVFTPDASPAGLAGPTTLPPSIYPNNLTGIELFLQTALDDAITQHYSDTQYVEVGASGGTATAVSYSQAVYFARDANVTGNICTFYTQYEDDFVLSGDRWLSRNKTIQVLGIVGNTSLIPPS